MAVSTEPIARFKSPTDKSQFDWQVSRAGNNVLIVKDTLSHFFGHARAMLSLGQPHPRCAHRNGEPTASRPKAGISPTLALRTSAI